MPISSLTTSLSEKELELPHDTDVRRVAQGGSIILLASILGNGLNYLFGIYAARYLGSGQFGLYALGLAIFNIIILIIPLGLETGVLKFVSEQVSRQNEEKVRSTVLQGLTIAFLSGVIASIFLFLLARPLAEKIYHKKELVDVLILFALAVPLASGNTLFINALQAFRIVRKIVLIKYFWEPTGKIVLTGLFFGLGFGLHGLLTAIIITLMISFFFGILSINEVVKFSEKGFPSWDGEGLRNLLVYCFPIVISNIFGVVAPRSDVLILGYWVSSQEIGIYNASFQTAAILALVLGAFDQIFAPLIGGVLAEKDWLRLERLYQTVSRWSLMLTFPLFLLMVVFSSEILSFFGKDFSDGRIGLVILVVGQLLNMVTGSAGTILLMSGHSNKVMWNTIFSSFLLILMNWILIPRFGQIGAAMGASLSLVFFGILKVIQIKKLYGIQPLHWNLFKPLLSGLLTLLVVLIIKNDFHIHYASVLGLFVILNYVFLLFLLKFEKNDYLLFTSLLRNNKRVFALVKAKET